MDSLQEWPEPVVRVQSLSDATIIPERYVKPPSMCPSISSQTDTSSHGLGIPVVNLAGLSDRNRGDDDIVHAVSDACREWGFFHLVNHGVSPDLMRRAREVWREFFYLPMEEKQKYANSPKNYEGYGSRLGVVKGASLDWGDYFFLHFLPNSLKNHDNWPSLPSSCRATVEEYAGEVVKLCRAILKLVSLGLGLEPEHLQKTFGGDTVGACLRVNFYPKCPQPDLTLGFSPHSDPGILTVLLPDDSVHGLQVRRGNTWITVEPIHDAFVVNVGDQIQVLSNATFKSVDHRVVVNSTRDRLSLALFYNPKSDVLIEPAKELVSTEQPSLYSSMTFDEYRLFVRKKGPQGKSQVESLKTTPVIPDQVKMGGGTF